MVCIVSISNPELFEMTRLPSKALNLSPTSRTPEIQGCHNMCLGVVCKFKESAKNTFANLDCVFLVMLDCKKPPEMN